MIRNLCMFLARTFLHRTVTSQASAATGGRLDPKLGFRLLRDRRVPMRFKLAALALGAAIAGIMQVLEMPLEVMLLFVPMLGLAADIAFDGVEIFAVVLGIASVTLPFLVPEELVRQARMQGDGRVFDAAPASSGRR